MYPRDSKKPTQVKWLDISKGDEENFEYRSRLVAKEIKTDNRLDLFEPTPPLEAKKLIFSQAAFEGAGYQKGQRKQGMKLDFTDISRAFFQAKAIRRGCVQLLDEAYQEGVCG